MANSPRTRQKKSLTAPLQRRLNAYALAASATGAAVLALTPASAAEIVYTPANAMVTRNGSLSLDVNNDGIVDFTIVEFAKGTSLRSTQLLSVIPAPGNHVMCGWIVCTSGNSYAAAVQFGKNIGTSQYGWLSFPRDNMAFYDFSGGRGESFGPWGHIFGNRARYLGLKFQINGETHFGWARLNVRLKQNSPRTFQAHLTGYAYETIPNKPIKAGQTTGDADAAARLNSKPRLRPLPVRHIPSSPARFATLGALALGADGLALWRREEQAMESQP